MIIRTGGNKMFSRHFSKYRQVSGKILYGGVYKMTYEELCDKLENSTPAEKLDAELEIMGKIYYLND